MNFPVIDISDLYSKDHQTKVKKAHEIGSVARDVGFFCVENHSITQNSIDNVYAASKAFFSQSTQFKMDYYVAHSTNHRGYVPFLEKGDYDDEVARHYEAFDLALNLPANDPDYRAGNLLLGPNVWPDISGFRDTVYGYYLQIAQIGRRICQAFEIFLGLPEGAITNHMRKPISQMRLLHYVHDTDVAGRGSVNMGAHTDYECLTLLHTANEGLQISLGGNNWMDVPVLPSAFVVNIGDMLEAWSNGILRSTLHRVVNTKPERYSLPYFVAADYHTRIKPFEALVGRGDPSVEYYEFVAGEHLERMFMRDFPYLRKRLAEKTRIAAKAQSYSNPFEVVA